MYTQLIADDFRTHFDLSPAYHVDGLLACGTWDIESEDQKVPLLKAALSNALGAEISITRLPHRILGHGYEFILNDGKRYWFIPVMGTALMSQYAHIASTLGSQINILIGVAGGLAKGMKSGDFIIPTSSRGNESAQLYQREASDSRFFPNTTLVEQFETLLSGQTIWKGETQTCEAMYAERPEDISDWSSRGYLGVEMETAMLFALSHHFAIPSAALLYVADNLIEEQTMYSEDFVQAKESRKAIKQLQYDVAVKVLLQNGAV